MVEMAATGTGEFVNCATESDEYVRGMLADKSQSRDLDQNTMSSQYFSQCGNEVTSLAHWCLAHVPLTSRD